MTSHETVWLLNAGAEDAHVRFNDLSDPAPIPVDRDFATLIESDVPIVVQHTRLDSRQAENALRSTIAFAGNE